MKQRVYIDTSVFGGHFDEEFRNHTVPLFSRINCSNFIVLYSTATQSEIENAPLQVRELVESLDVENKEVLETTTESIDFTSEYISKIVVRKTSFADCIDIAVGIINRADFLFRWIFRHIVNVERIRGCNS